MDESKKPEYWFKCQGCGSARVKRSFFLKYLNDELKIAINEQFEQGSTDAYIVFDNYKCPRCQPKGEHQGTVGVTPHDPKKN